MRNNDRALHRLAEFTPDPALSNEINRQRALMLQMEVERTTGLLQNIANELTHTGETAARMINGESLNIFQHAYTSNVANLQRQVNGMNLGVRFDLIDNNALNAIFNGDNTALSQLPGFRESFTQVGFRQTINDRIRGRHFFDIAAGRLGDSRPIVVRLQNALAESMILGESIPQIARRISRITESCRKQAVRIARTETMRASNSGKYLSAEQAVREYGLEIEKIWHSAIDEVVRDWHLAANKQIVDFEQPFIVMDEELMYPNDPNGSPENTIQCRCTFTTRIKGVNRGAYYEERLAMARGRT